MLNDPNNKPSIDCNDLFLKNNPDSNWRGREGEEEPEYLQGDNGDEQPDEWDLQTGDFCD